MTVSAVFVFIAVTFAAAAFTTAFTVSAMLSTTSAATRHLLDERVDFCFCGRTVFNHFTSEIQGFASHRVIGIYRYSISLEFNNAGREMMILCIAQGDNGSLIDVFRVKFAINGENLTLQLVNSLRLIFPKSFSRCQRKIKLTAFFQGEYLIFKCFERHSKATDKLEWLFANSLFLKCALTVFY